MSEIPPLKADLGIGHKQAVPVVAALIILDAHRN
jgi:hypothetical protein